MLPDHADYKYRFSRDTLRIGDTITYQAAFTSNPLHGVIFHIGLGQAIK
jgi:hypothetical protein